MSNHQDIIPTKFKELTISWYNKNYKICIKLIENKRVNLLPKIKPLKSALEEIEVELFDNSIKDSNHHYTIATEIESRNNQHCPSGRCDDWE